MTSRGNSSSFSEEDNKITTHDVRREDREKEKENEQFI